MFAINFYAAGYFAPHYFAETGAVLVRGKLFSLGLMGVGQ